MASAIAWIIKAIFEFLTIKLRLTYGDMASLSCKSGRPKKIIILDIIIIKTMQHGGKGV